MIRSNGATHLGRTEDRSRRQFLKQTAAVAMGALGAGITGRPDVVWAADDPIWQAIPDQTWAVGVPVRVDLANYASSQIGKELLFSINKALPNGVSLNGSVISGVPTAIFSGSGYVVVAEDGQVSARPQPNSPTGLVAT